MATSPATSSLVENVMDSGSSRGEPSRSYDRALGAVLLTFVLLGGLYLLPYVFRSLWYPIGYDVPYYVVSAKQAAAGGIAEITSVRVGTPVLLASLGAVTRQDAFALVAWFPAVLTVVSALGAAAMVRVALRIRPIWVPLIGFLTWAVFGRNGMLNLHLDNLVNAALVLSAYGAALAIVAWGRGGIAVTLLLIAAGYAHWTFYVFALTVYALAVLAFAGRDVWRSVRGQGGSLGIAVSLLAPAVASGALFGLPLLLASSDRTTGVRLRAEFLKRRFILRLKDSYRYFGVPFALLGALVAARASGGQARVEPRRFFLWLMAAWVVVTVAAGFAQFAGYPTAGGRLLHYFFAVPILTGVLVWWLGRSLTERLGRAGKVYSVGVAVVFLAGFGALAWSLESSIALRFSRGVVEQTSIASKYVSDHAPDRCVVFLLGARRYYNAARGALQVERIGDARAYLGSIREYLGRPHRFDCSRSGGKPVALILEGFNPDEYGEAVLRTPERVVAPGVLVLDGPIPRGPIGPVAAPISNSPARVIGVALALLAVLLATGSGWSVGLLPPDPVLRVILAPGLGIASMMLVALLWSAVGLSLTGWVALGPSVAALGLGWAVAGARWHRSSRAGLGSDGGPEASVAGEARGIGEARW